MIAARLQKNVGAVMGSEAARLEASKIGMNRLRTALACEVLQQFSLWITQQSRVAHEKSRI
jgi:hypothetical protein